MINKNNYKQLLNYFFTYSLKNKELLSIIFLFIIVYYNSTWFFLTIHFYKTDINSRYCIIIILGLFLIIEYKKFTKSSINEFYLFGYWGFYVFVIACYYFSYVASFLIPIENVSDFLIHHKIIKIKINYSQQYFIYFCENYTKYTLNNHYLLDNEIKVYLLKIADPVLHEYILNAKENITLQNIKNNTKSFLDIATMIYFFKDYNSFLENVNELLFLNHLEKLLKNLFFSLLIMEVPLNLLLKKLMPSFFFQTCVNIINKTFVKNNVIADPQVYFTFAKIMLKKYHAFYIILKDILLK